MLGSLERIGGTPSILWGIGVARKGKQASADAEGDDRRAVPSRRDLVPRRGRARRHPARAAELLRAARRATPTSCPDPATRRTARTAAWGRRLAKRFGHEPHFDDREFTVAVKGRKPPCVPVLDASAVKATGGAKVVSLVGELDAARGKAMIAFGWAVAEELAAGSYVAAC